MTPINAQFNSTLFMLNAFNSFASNNSFSTTSSASIFGNTMPAFGNFDSFSANASLLNAFNSFNFQMPAFNFQMPAFNFNFSAAPAVNMPTFNFGSFGTNVRSHQVRFTSNRAQNAVSLAMSQIGVRENGSSNDGAQIREYKNGQANSNAWCASFVSWCYGRGQNGNNAKTFGYDASTQSIRRKAQNAGYYSELSTGYVPQVGDLAIWKYSEGKGHVAIVTKVNADGSFETVEGNCGNKVQRVTRTRNTESLHGFVRMNEWLEA